MTQPSIAPTVGEIAKQLGEPLHRIEYIIRSRNIQPASRAGNVRIFAEAEVAHIADQLRQIDARHEQTSDHNAPGTEGGGAS